MGETKLQAKLLLILGGVFGGVFIGILLGIFVRRANRSTAAKKSNAATVVLDCSLATPKLSLDSPKLILSALWMMIV